MKWMAKDLNLDAEVLTELLLDREKLQPTALNHGIGIPHTRDFLLDAHHDVVTIAYPKKPIPYGALDGQPVHTLFFLFASDDGRHLHLLAKIAHLSSQPETLELLKTKPSKDVLLDYIKNWESEILKVKE
jgi:PTS system nitrogen regulatory IIA component